MGEDFCNKPIWDIYISAIKPKIEEIDIKLKEKRELSIKETCEMLEITEEELKDILKRVHIKKIDYKNIFEIMLNANSYICKIFKRELECGTPYFYTPQNIAYIYDIDEKEVVNAFNFLDLKLITTNQIPLILKQIV